MELERSVGWYSSHMQTEKREGTPLFGTAHHRGRVVLLVGILAPSFKSSVGTFKCLKILNHCPITNNKKKGSVGFGAITEHLV